MSELHQIGRASTAATTTFCAAKLPLEPSEPDFAPHLWIDGNDKITAGNGKYGEPSPNAFSIVEADDCPYRTPTCEAACYVHGLKAAAPDLHALYEHNSRTIRKLISSPLVSWAWAADVMAAWISEHCAGGFRWHVSGDVYSAEYAEFIERVCLRSPDVQHWIYTRSFPDSAILYPLLGASTVTGGNLAINLSADRDNYWLARRIGDRHGLRVCYMTTDGDVPIDLREGDVIFPDYSLRGPKGATPSAARAGSGWWNSLEGEQQRMVCPVDFYGKSEAIRCQVPGEAGGCDRCTQ